LACGPGEDKKRVNHMRVEAEFFLGSPKEINTADLRRREETVRKKKVGGRVDPQKEEKSDLHVKRWIDKSGGGGDEDPQDGGDNKARGGGTEEERGNLEEGGEVKRALTAARGRDDATEKWEKHAA